MIWLIVLSFFSTKKSIQEKLPVATKILVAINWKFLQQIPIARKNRCPLEFFFYEEVNTRKTPCCNKISCCNKLKIFATNTYCNEKPLPITAINSVAIGYHKKIMVAIIFCRNKEQNQGNKCRARDDAARYIKPETQNMKPQTANPRG